MSNVVQYREKHKLHWAARKGTNLQDFRRWE